MISKAEKKLETVEDFYVFKFGAMWRYCTGQHFSFWMICCYLFFEFVRPQSIFPQIDVLPFAQLFILGAFTGAIMDSTVKWVSCPANKVLISFLVTVLISILFAYYPEVSRKHFMDIFNWVIIYFLIINIVNTRERFYVFVFIFLLAGSKIAIGTSKSWAMRGFSFTSWGLSGPPGYFQNSGELAILMLILFPLAYYLYISLKGKIGVWESRILLLLWICPILTILGASSRGSQIALLLELIIIFRKSFFRPKPLIGVVVLSISLFHLLPEEQMQRFADTGDDKTSQQRLLYWKHGWDMMKENPLTGVGFFNFIPYYDQHFSQDVLYEGAQLPHNICIQVGTDVGFIGLGFFLGLNFLCFLESRRLSMNKGIDPVFRAIAAGLGIGVFGFYIAGQFVTVTYYPFLWINLSLLMALKNIALTKTHMNKNYSPFENSGKNNPSNKL